MVRMQPLAQEVSKWPVAGSLEHVPGKGLLSLWPVPYAIFSSASVCLLSVGLDGVSVSEAMPGKLLEEGTGGGCRASASRSHRVSCTLDLQLQKKLR